MVGTSTSTVTLMGHFRMDDTITKEGWESFSNELAKMFSM